MEDHDYTTMQFGAIDTSSTNVESVWADTPPTEDHNSISSDAHHSYNVPIHDPESTNGAANQSKQTTNGRIRNAGVASSSSRISKRTGNSSRDSKPMSTYNDHDSTVAGGSENLWDTTLNTPRTELSIQERIANTAISGTIELLKQVGGVTVSATGALVAPPLHITRTVLIPSLFAAMKDFISSNSPVRLKDWFRIFSASIYHVFNTLQNTEAGHEFSNRMLVVMIDLIDCISAETTRQLLLDGMSCFVKFFEIIHTPIFQSYCEQLAISGCRLIDALSNGRNKLLLFDMQKAVTSAGELLADPATTVALAEVTAYLCYALEMEDQQIQIDEHRHIPMTTTGSTNNGGGSQRRKVRDTYQDEAALQRDTLDNGHSVEEAILSSLGVVNDYQNDCHGGASIPASIIVDPDPQNKTMFNDVSTGPNQNNHQDISKTLEWHERARNDVDVHVLREGILQRAHDLKEATKLKQNSSLPPKKPHAGIDCKEVMDNMLDKTTIDEQILDLEEQDVQDKVTTVADDVGCLSKARRNKQTVAFQPPNADHEKEKEKNMTFTDCNSFGLPVMQRERAERKEGENANEHFYRILDEILGEARKDSANKIIAEQMAQPTGIKAGISRNLRQNGPSNSTIKDRLNEIRLELKESKHNATKTKKRSISSTMLDKTGKKFFLVVGLVALSIVTFWFLMGCYGLYVYFNPSALLQESISSRVDNSGGAATPHEIVIRVVKEIVHVSQDGEELGREPWNEHDGSNVKLEKGLEHEKIASCIASAYA